MDLNSVLNTFKGWLESVLHSDWLGTAIVVIVIILATALCAFLVKVFLRRILQSTKGPIPAASIFINIGRIIVWAIGICIILSSCFGINVQAAITALGIGGIAISLGFQGTLSNLIGGLQIILTGIVEPGDLIKVAGYQGTVHDVTWRHTTITTIDGETVIVPNSVINSDALVKLHPQKNVRFNIIITSSEKPLGTLVSQMEKKIDEAVEKVTVLKHKSSINIISKDEKGYQALVSLVTSEGVKKATIEESIMEAIGDDAVKARGFTATPDNDRAIGKKAPIRLLRTVRVLRKRKSEGSKKARTHGTKPTGSTKKTPKEGDDGR